MSSNNDRGHSRSYASGPERDYSRHHQDSHGKKRRYPDEGESDYPDQRRFTAGRDRSQIGGSYNGSDSSHHRSGGAERGGYPRNNRYDSASIRGRRDDGVGVRGDRGNAREGQRISSFGNNDDDAEDTHEGANSSDRAEEKHQRQNGSLVTSITGAGDEADTLTTPPSSAHEYGVDDAVAIPDEFTVPNEDAVIEAARQRRAALRQKLAARDSANLLQKALHASTAAADAGVHLAPQSPSSTTSSTLAASSTPGGSSPGSPLETSTVNETELMKSTVGSPSDGSSPAGPSAADYDPSMDMQEDRARVSKHLDPIIDNNKSSDQHGKKAKEEPKMFDMFNDDLDDDDFDDTAAVAPKSDSNVASYAGRRIDKDVPDEWDDSEGYYRVTPGEFIDDRYEMKNILGKGVFSAVVSAIDRQTNEAVAIKINRRQETMYRAALKEIRTLETLADADPDDKMHIIRMKRHVMYRGHLCMVFEHLSINLREVLKKYGRNVGINIKGVRVYAQQLFIALAHLRRCNILHADLKPDNILVNEKRSQLKMADLGSAINIEDSEVTDILVSRFYRAPEIMLGIKGDYALDMWSIGCTLFELCTGRLCFTGESNNQMLKAILECRGKFPNRMLKKAEYWAQHFAPDGTFLSEEYDKLLRKEVVRRLNIVRPTPAKELKARLFAGNNHLSIAETKELNSFADLLDRCLALDPVKRITPSEALKHGFISRSVPTTTIPANAQ